MLFLSVPDSDLATFLSEVHQLIQSAPGLLQLVDADLDVHGKAKKAQRLADAEWLKARTAALPGCDCEVIEIEPASLTLSQGRPRTPAYVVLTALFLRGYFGAGFKACDSSTMLRESMSLQILLSNVGVAMPGRSTLTELVNAVTNATRERVLDAQVAYVIGQKWDDFKTMLLDSTHAEGNTEWPTDSHTLVALIERVLRIGGSLPRLQLPAINCLAAHNHLAAMTSLDKQIGFAPRGKKREMTLRQLYKKLLWRARRVQTLLHEAVSNTEEALFALEILPSLQAMATRAVARLREDTDAVAQVIVNCRTRVMYGAKVPLADKVLSTSDPDAGFIAKGQREPVIGYKPQVARSGDGFITALMLPQGNAADSRQLIPMIDAVSRRTRVVPTIVSVDDGYASQANVDAARARSIQVISINGAKGRALTAKADWDSEAYVDARNKRSAIESLLFTLKQGFGFGEVARRGLTAVHGELLEKALAYNLCRMATVRRTIANTGTVRVAA